MASILFNFQIIFSENYFHFPLADLFMQDPGEDSTTSINVYISKTVPIVLVIRLALLVRPERCDGLHKAKLLMKLSGDGGFSTFQFSNYIF